MTNGPMRSAIIGGGMIANVHHRAIAAAGGVTVGVLGSSPARSAIVAAQWGTKSYASFADLLSDEVDVVHICTPNATHAAYAFGAIEAGMHVVCEKPIATSYADASRMASLASRKGVVATVPFVYRYHPVIHELRERRLAGEFGKWLALHGSYLQDWMLDPTTGNWRVNAADGGGSRAFGDIGSHWCDLVEFVSGAKFERLVASTKVAVPTRPAHSKESFRLADVHEHGEPGELLEVTTEDIAAVILQTTSGAIGNVVVSQVAGGRRNRLWFELDGERESAVFDQENPETAWLGSPASVTRIARGAGPMSPQQARLSFLPGGHVQGYQDCFNAFVADTFAAIRGDVVAGLPTFADGLRAAHITHAVLESAATGQWVEITEPRRARA
jgi:predicted dehydrogenase